MEVELKNPGGVGGGGMPVLEVQSSSRATSMAQWGRPHHNTPHHTTLHHAAPEAQYAEASTVELSPWRILSKIIFQTWF